MENLRFEFESREGRTGPRPPVVVGVVASGNLEVLVEPVALPGRCRFAIETSARGFGPIWEAVLRDFTERHAAAGLSLSIHDAGATPAVVSLRLDQAIEEYMGVRS